MLTLSRQAYYSAKKRYKLVTEANEYTLYLASLQRSIHPKMSCKKIYIKIRKDLEEAGIKIGRDKFISLMVGEGLHVKRKRRYKSTTYSDHKNKTYENLIKGKVIDKADYIWVSDITYIDTSQGFLYLSLVTDLYSRKIVGYNLADSLMTSESLKALQMALKTCRTGAEIHHSDRGIQYCSEMYMNKLKIHNIVSSMSKKASPHENAVAERLNGILKQEYAISDRYQTKEQAKKVIKQAIKLYNTDRPHINLNMETPQKVYENYYSKNCNL